MDRPAAQNQNWQLLPPKRGQVKVRIFRSLFQFKTAVASSSQSPATSPPLVSSPETGQGTPRRTSSDVGRDS
ncbi:hypothetical protein MLD38_011624 [Melastoma candidum]|uniref:Uncharacterized protein n=1 Tax=Melastoma candidum TaxID=119954 RepID=A0ACB9R475_9MYRT|nr:hypothetical protein MLD38_011624 [Melastoma candidum]